MKNFPFEYQGNTYWYSRSVACSMYVYVYDESIKEWYVIVSMRGPGCPSNVGKWNVPGGYLDFNETLEQAAARECFEETGVALGDINKIKLASVSTDPHSKSQNVVCSFYYECKVNNINEISKMFTTEHSEPDEVFCVSLKPVSWFFTCPEEADKSFAFGHDKMIQEIFKKRINVSPWKKWIIDSAEKLTKININIL